MTDVSVFDDWTQQDVRAWVDELSDVVGDMQGIPVPLGEDNPVVVHPKHPLREFFMPPVERSCTVDDVRDDERVVNHWFSRKMNANVYIVERAGVYSAVLEPVSPDRSMERLTFWMSTIGGADAWDLHAERTARRLLRGMLTDRQWHHYDLTGSFFETSPRSRVTYLFRRLRPTVALTPRGRNGSEDSMHCLAVLCLHPIGYYARSWAGCMTPSDDVIAHLTMVRADEPLFWRKAIHHRPHEPEAGL